jgi:hypothetical protein
MRELSTDDLIKVFYPDDLYTQVAKAVQERNTTLIVDGEIKYDKVTRQTVELKADRIKSMDMMTPQEFEEVFGCAPNFEPSPVEEGEWLN